MNLKQGDKLELIIEDSGINGEGIAKKDGVVVFVPFAIKGERVYVRIDYVKKNYAYATLLDVIEISPFRVKPICNRFTRCGGCDMLHVAYEEQLRIKKHALQTTFAKNYPYPVDIDDVRPSKQFEYRNKLAIPFGTVNGRTAVGFYREGTHKIVSITKCFLQGKWAEDLIEIVLDYANEYDIFAYDAERKSGVLRHLYARMTEGFLSVTLVVTKFPRGVVRLNEALATKFPKYALYLNFNTKETNVILGDKTEFIGGKEENIEIRNVKTTLDPNSFLQVNDMIRDLIYDEVDKMISVGAGSVVFDAYAGIGLLGASFAKKNAKVYNLEIVKEAVQDGDRLVKENGLENKVMNICCDSAEKLPVLLKEAREDLLKCSVHEMRLRHKYFDLIKRGEKTVELRLCDEKRSKVKVGESICFQDMETDEKILCEVVSLDKFPSFETLFSKVDVARCGMKDVSEPVAFMTEFYTKEEQAENGVLAIGVKVIKPRLIVILDPPRKGCAEAVLNALNDADELIYISCNPATLTRDLAILSPTFVPTKIIPFDMFPNTRHLETLVQLSHKTPDSHIVVKVDFDKDNSIQTDTLLKNAEPYKPAERVTYKMIQAYVEEKYGFKVHTAYIAEVKRSYGLPMYDAPNAVEELKRSRQHPSEKMVEAIKDALKNYGII